MEHPKDWLAHLDSQRLAALNAWLAEKSRTEKLAAEIGGSLDSAKAGGLHRQLIAEIQAENRHIDSQREYLNFLGYMRKNGLF
jgi:hypothetical protein